MTDEEFEACKIESGYRFRIFNQTVVEDASLARFFHIHNDMLLDGNINEFIVDNSEYRINFKPVRDQSIHYVPVSIVGTKDEECTITFKSAGHRHRVDITLLYYNSPVVQFVDQYSNISLTFTKNEMTGNDNVRLAGFVLYFEDRLRGILNNNPSLLRKVMHDRRW